MPSWPRLLKLKLKFLWDPSKLFHFSAVFLRSLVSYGSYDTHGMLRGGSPSPHRRGQNIGWYLPMVILTSAGSAYAIHLAGKTLPLFFCLWSNFILHIVNIGWKQTSHHQLYFYTAGFIFFTKKIILGKSTQYNCVFRLSN